MNNNILFLLVILLSANQISAYCFHNPAPDGDSQPAVCTYEGSTYSPDETWDTGNCEQCTCDISGAFGCCGYGFSAGVMNYGDECKVHQFDCLNGVVIPADVASDCAMAGTEIHLTRSK